MGKHDHYPEPCGLLVWALSSTPCWAPPEDFLLALKVIALSSSPSSYGWTLQWRAQVSRLSGHLLTPGERRGKTSRSNNIQLASHHPQEPCLLQGGLVVLPEGLSWSDNVSYYSIQLGLEKAQQFFLWSRSSKVAHLPTPHPALVFWRGATALCGNGALKG